MVISKKGTLHLTERGLYQVLRPHATINIQGTNKHINDPKIASANRLYLQQKEFLVASKM